MNYNGKAVDIVAPDMAGVTVIKYDGNIVAVATNELTEGETAKKQGKKKA